VAARTAELQQALEALQQADARRRQLFADISHELRTPTTAIRGEAEITLRGADRPADDYKRRAAPHRRHLAPARCGDRRPADHGAQRHRRAVAGAQPLDLAEPARDALGQASALAADARRELQAESLEAGRCFVLGDGQRLRQLLLMLLDNAAALQRGRAGRCSSAAADATDDHGWCVEVRDDGIGIPAHELPQVFDRHFRGHEARRQRPDGSGLGLTIAQALARAHGGRIELSACPGRAPPRASSCRPARRRRKRCRRARCRGRSWQREHPHRRGR
jgi:two-component system, OmpR family, sensor kinase